MELNELFKAADQCGRKYQDPKEVEAYEQQLYEVNKEIKESTSPFVRAMELCNEPEVEAMSIGDRTEFDLKVSNIPIPDAGKGRFGNLIKFLEE